MSHAPHYTMRSMSQLLTRWGRWSTFSLCCGLYGCAGLDQSQVRVSHTTEVRAQSPDELTSSRVGRATLNSSMYRTPSRSNTAATERTANRRTAAFSTADYTTADDGAIEVWPNEARVSDERSATQALTRSRSPYSNRNNSLTGGKTKSVTQVVGGQKVVREGAVERIAASARTPALCPDPYGVGQAWDESEASPTAFPDEYLFDGGDRGYSIGANTGFDYQGLETEDTIAEYKDHEDRRKVKHSNRIAIYAPRFGSVISVSGPNSDTLVDKVQGHVAAQGGVGLGGRAAVAFKGQTVETGRLQTRSRSTIVGTEIGTDSIHRGLNREVSVSVLNTHERFGQQRVTLLEDKLRPYSKEGMAFAEHWNRTDFPVLQGLSISASQDVRVSAQAELVGLEDFGKRGDLRLHKAADKGAATIGETITFTIHYENRGDKELKNVVIIDNLTPRLEFIYGSESSDRPGKIEIVDNGEGSVILRFVLAENLPGRTKGSVTFQAKVK